MKSDTAMRYDTNANFFYVQVSKLSKQYSSLLGHQNHNQKIKHVVQLKQENVTLKSRVEALQLDLSK